MPDIFLALGSNLGDRADHLAQARSHLTQFLHHLEASPIYETEPWGVLDQPPFLNQVLRAHTTLMPEALLDRVKAIERAMGRDFHQVRYGPRIIDIDILAYHRLIFRSSRLAIPHLRLAERAFVLVPFHDLAPHWRHPQLDLTVAQMLDQVDTSGVHPWPMPYPSHSPSRTHS